MKRIGRELHDRTSVFSIVSETGEGVRILDLCMAPGGFLDTALNKMAGSTALAFSLPACDGGHKVLLPKYLSKRVEKRFLDITMLAEDLGRTWIPEDHPDAKNFLPRQLGADKLFDLVFCDGQVLRTHERAVYRENREVVRLSTTQLALVLEHLRTGGSMVVLLHKLDSYETLHLIQTFRQFSSVQLCKPTQGHAKRSSFYMVASAVQSRDLAALRAIESWKLTWTTITFGSDKEYLGLLRQRLSGVETFLEKFGAELAEMGHDVWRIQAEALAKSPFIKSSLQQT